MINEFSCSKKKKLIKYPFHSEVGVYVNKNSKMLENITVHLILTTSSLLLEGNSIVYDFIYNIKFVFGNMVETQVS